MSILKGLENLLEENLRPFHVPGHKGRLSLPNIMKDIGKIDITEIPGSDNLHKAQGMILQAEKKASRIFGARKTYFLVNGTTAGIQAMMLSQCKPGDKLIVPRNCHRAVWNGLILGDIKPIYIYPKAHPKTGIGLSITAGQVEEKLNEYPDIKGMILTYPSYYGTCSNIEGISRVLHDKNKLLLVDEAHGAHFAFHDGLPLPALKGGSDIAVQSTHKLLSSFTQTSMLHVGNTTNISLESLEMFLSMLQSSSPSYPFMASLEFASIEAEKKGYKKWDDILRWNSDAISKIVENTAFIPIGKDIIGKYGVTDFDKSRFLIDVTLGGLTGIEVDRLLRKEFAIQVELSDYHYILAITGMGTEESDIIYFTEAIIDIYKSYGSKSSKELLYDTPMIKVQTLLSPRDAVYAPEEKIPLKKSIGRISKEFIIPYPPGIPIVAPGEMISKDIIDAIGNIKSRGGQVIGPFDSQLNTMRVVKDK